MAHELEINADGTANMVWSGEAPWHGLGQELDPKEGALAWMKAAGLDWSVELSPMHTTLPNGEVQQVLGKGGSPYNSLIRNRDGVYDVLGPVGPEWVPVQNEDVFQFMDKFCSAGHMQMETCGAMKNGTEIWALAKFSDDFDIVKGDTMKGYLLFHSAHVWGKGNQVRVTGIRVVCNNTLTMAIGSSGKKAGGFHMPHIRAFDTDIQKTAELALGLADEQMGVFREQASLLATKKATEKQAQEFIAKLYQPKLFADGPIEGTYIENFTPTSDNVWEAINTAPGSQLNGSRGTWWGVFNGVTYHEDHMRWSYTDQSNVLSSAWFGGGARRKLQALEMAIEYAQAA